MLLEFSCSNHKSIKDKVVFSALAGTDTTNEDCLETFSGLRVLKSALIYGANGSGKSNFIDAIAFMKNLVINSVALQPGQGIRQVPHKLEGYEKESTYQMHFVTGGIRYVYGFSLKSMIVSEEYLYFYPNGKLSKIFDRTGEDFSVGSKFRGRFSSCKEVLKPNRLLLSCSANFTSIEEVLSVFSFFQNDIVIFSPSIQDNWMSYSLHQISENESLKNAVISFMGELGQNVKDIVVTVDKKRIEESEIPSFLSDDFKKILVESNADSITAKVIYEKFETDLIHEESTGVQKLFSLLCPLLDIMAKGKVLICDELESSLHESIVLALVKLFMSVKTEGFAQMVLTTHETGLMDLELLRRDQIWFTEMSESDRSTDLYSLAELKNVRKEENFGRGYISGKYGAIPMLNLDFASTISGINGV